MFQGSPAAQAGLTHGDLIVAVGSTSLAGRSSAFASGLIKGRAGTNVKLTVRRGARMLHLTISARAWSYP